MAKADIFIQSDSTVDMPHRTEMLPNNIAMSIDVRLHTLVG
jgi:hypothetical protein